MFIWFSWMDYPSSLGATFIHSHKLHTNNFWLWLKENYPLISLLLRSTLFLFTVGPFYNWDTNIEFQAATGVLQWGKPYLNFDNLINQPPIGFYIEAAFFKIFATDSNSTNCSNHINTIRHRLYFLAVQVRSKLVWKINWVACRSTLCFNAMASCPLPKFSY